MSYNSLPSEGSGATFSLNKIENKTFNLEKGEHSLLGIHPCISSVQTCFLSLFQFLYIDVPLHNILPQFRKYSLSKPK